MKRELFLEAKVRWFLHQLAAEKQARSAKDICQVGNWEMLAHSSAGR
jgi:hypothetical protein